MGADNFSIADLYTLAILNELLRKDLLIASARYVSKFQESAPFDYSRPISYPDFIEFLKDDVNTRLKLDQFVFNLELFIVKLYNVGESDKSAIKETHLKALRQAFAHRRSYDILAGQERAVFVAGLLFDFQSFEVAAMTEGGKEAKYIPYGYSKYVDLLVGDIIPGFENQKSSIKQTRELNTELMSNLFPNTPPQKVQDESPPSAES